MAAIDFSADSASLDELAAKVAALIAGAGKAPELEAQVATLTAANASLTDANAQLRADLSASQDAANALGAKIKAISDSLPVA